MTEHMPKHRKIWGISAILAGLVVLLAVLYSQGGAGSALVYDLRARWELWRANVKPFEKNGVTGFRRNTCQPGQAGSCKCVALIHGMGDHALTWRRVLLGPPEGWTPRFDLYAFGLQAGGPRQQAARLREAMQPLCRSWIVAGNSLGGWVAAWLALDWPEGVERLLLLSPAGISKAVSAAAGQVPLKVFENPSIEGLKEFQARAYHKPRELPQAAWEAALNALKTSDLGAWRAAQVPDDDLDNRLHAIRTPTMILWGESDRILPPALGRVFKEGIPGAILRPIENCGHLPQKECPIVVIRSIVEMSNFGAM